MKPRHLTLLAAGTALASMLGLAFAGALPGTAAHAAIASQQIQYLGPGTATCFEFTVEGKPLVGLEPADTVGQNIRATCKTWTWMVFPKSSGWLIEKITAPNGASFSYNLRGRP